MGVDYMYGSGRMLACWCFDKQRERERDESVRMPRPVSFFCCCTKQSVCGVKIIRECLQVTKDAPIRGILPICCWGVGSLLARLW